MLMSTLDSACDSNLMLTKMASSRPLLVLRQVGMKLDNDLLLCFLAIIECLFEEKEKEIVMKCGQTFIRKSWLTLYYTYTVRLVFMISLTQVVLAIFKLLLKIYKCKK